MNPQEQCPFWKLNEFLLKCYGLWPYQAVVFKRSFYFVFVIYAASCLLPTIQGFMEEEQLDIVISFESIVGITTIVGAIGQCSSLYFRAASVKQLYDQIESDWKSTIDPMEQEILRKHSRRGKLLSFIYTVSFTGGYVWFLCLTYVPLLLRKGVPPEYLRSVPYYSTRWIIDGRFRHLQAFLHGNLGIFYAEFVYMAATSMYICCVHHTCGMYAIVGYDYAATSLFDRIESFGLSFRLRKLVKKSKMRILVKKTKEDNRIITELLNIVERHKEAIKAVHLIKRTFSRVFFPIQLGALICLAMLIFDCNYNMGRSWLLTSRIFFIMAMFAEYLFYMNYGGQRVIDYSNGVLTSTNFMQWYLLSPDARKTLMMIIRRGLKGDMLNAGVMTLSLENFTTIIKFSWSLACMLLSSQKKV